MKNSEIRSHSDTQKLSDWAARLWRTMKEIVRNELEGLNDLRASGAKARYRCSRSD
jgi:hypothetical protein